MDRKYLVALEFSGTQVKGVLASTSLRDTALTSPVIDALVAEDNPDSVQFGRVQNLISASQLGKSIVRKLEAESILDGGTIESCYLSVAGRSLASEKRTVEIPFATEMEISPEILRKLYAEASKTNTPNVRVLKVLPRKFYVDNHAMSNPVGNLGRRLKGDFTLVVCHTSNQRNLDLVVKDRIHLDVNGYIVAPVAMADLLLGDEEKQLGCAMVDIGGQTTTIAIYKDRGLQYLATLPMGSDNITRDISVGLNVTMEKAEDMKRRQGDATAQITAANDEESRMNAYVAARAFEIVANIVANIEYAGYKPAELAAGFVLCGRGARLKNFDRLIEESSKMRVRHATIPASVNFGFNTASVPTSDYLSLLAVAEKAAQKPDFVNCVDFGAESVEIATDIFNEPEPEPQPPMPIEEDTTVTNTPVDDDDDNDDWSKDDPDPRDNPPITINSRGGKNKDEDKPNQTNDGKDAGLISKIKFGLNRIFSTDIGDAELDDE